MRKFKKVLALTACAAMLVVGSVAGTLAWLTSSTSVTNSFTVGDVGITMVESVVSEYGVPTNGTTDEGNTYKLIPGHIYTKDPKITVSSDSENCYLFVKIENQLGNDATIYYSEKDAQDKVLFTNSAIQNQWENVKTDGNSSVWAYVGTQSTNGIVSKNTIVPVFGSFKFGDTAKPTDHVNDGVDNTKNTNDDVSNKIIVTAYAIQADGLTDKTNAERWSKLETQLQSNP